MNVYSTYFTEQVFTNSDTGTSQRYSQHAQSLFCLQFDLTVASSQYVILLCSETLVSDMRHVSEVLVPGFCRPVLLCRGKMPRARGMAAYVRDGYGAFSQPKFECGCCEMLRFRVCGVRQKLYVYSLYRNPDRDDQIFDCLLALMAAVQAEDVCASFLFVGELNGHHQ